MWIQSKLLMGGVEQWDLALFVTVLFKFYLKFLLHSVKTNVVRNCFVFNTACVGNKVAMATNADQYVDDDEDDDGDHDDDEDDNYNDKNDNDDEDVDGDDNNDDGYNTTMKIRR